jgi:hypothetical protein
VFDFQRQLSENGRMGNKDGLEELADPRTAARAASQQPIALTAVGVTPPYV